MLAVSVVRIIPYIHLHSNGDGTQMKPPSLCIAIVSCYVHMQGSSVGNIHQMIWRNSRRATLYIIKSSKPKACLFLSNSNFGYQKHCDLSVLGDRGSAASKNISHVFLSLSISRECCLSLKVQEWNKSDPVRPGPSCRGSWNSKACGCKSSLHRMRRLKLDKRNAKVQTRMCIILSLRLIGFLICDSCRKTGGRTF